MTTAAKGRLSFPELNEAQTEYSRLKAELEDIEARIVADPDHQGLKERHTNVLRGLNKLKTKVQDLVAVELTAKHALSTGKGLERDGDDPFHQFLSKSAGIEDARTWAAAAADRFMKAGKAEGVKALLTGSVDIPTVLSSSPITLPRNPARVVDLLVDRNELESNNFEYLRQTVRTNNAAPVADLGTKPTSVFTLDPIEDRARVVAHLSEPVPERFFMDHTSVIQFLEAEMFSGVLDALEAQLIAGDGLGENFTGIRNTVGIQAQAFDTNLLTSARKARTTMANSHESPTAWVFNPTDMETVDLLTETGGAFIADDGLENIFGTIPKVVTTSIPAGTALLGDWRQIRLLVREDMTLAADRTGDNFTKNQVVLRAEGRFGIAVLRPQAFIEVALTAP